MRERMGVAVPAALAVVAAGGVGFGAYMLNERNVALEQLGHQSELTGSIATLETEVAGLAARTKQAEDALAGLQSQLDTAEAELLAVRTEHERLTSEVGPMREEIAAFGTRRAEAEKGTVEAVAEFDAAQTRLKELTTREDTLRATVTRLTAQAQDLDKRMEGLRTESGQLVEAAQSAERQRSDLQGMIELLAQVLAARSKELVDLEQKIGAHDLTAPTGVPAAAEPEAEAAPEAAEAPATASPEQPAAAAEGTGDEAAPEPAPAEAATGNMAEQPEAAEAATGEAAQPEAAEASSAEPAAEPEAADAASSAEADAHVPAGDAAPAAQADSTAAPQAAPVDLAPGAYSIGPLEVNFAANGRFTMRNTELDTSAAGRWRVEDGQLILREPKGVTSSSSFPMICRIVASDSGMTLEKAEKGACPLSGQPLTPR